MAREAPNLVVVLGMHRAGTSLAARALASLGVELGEDLVPPMPGVNDTGFWEDRAIVEFNDDLLRRMGRRWDDLRTIDPAEFDAAALADMRAGAVDLLRRKTAGIAVFGVKDPRMARLVPFWREAIRSIGLRVAYVIAIRDPASVALSLARRDGFHPAKSHLLWLGHSVDAALDSAPDAGRAPQEPRVVLDYDALVDDPFVQLRRVSEALGLAWDAAAVRKFVDGFVDRELRHHREEARESTPPRVDRLYASLRAAAGDAGALDSAELRTELEQARDWLREAAPLLGYATRCDRSLELLASPEAVHDDVPAAGAAALLAVAEPIGNAELDVLARAARGDSTGPWSGVVKRLLSSELDLGRAMQERNLALRERDAANEASVRAHAALEIARREGADLQAQSNRAHEALESERAEFARARDASVAELQRLRETGVAERTRLSGELQAVSDRAGELRSDLERMERERAELGAVVARIGEERIALGERVASLERTLIAERARDQATHEAKARELEGLRRQLSLERERHASTLQSARVAQDMLERHRSALQATRDELDAVRGSVSWRTVSAARGLLALPGMLGGKRARRRTEAHALRRASLFDAAWYLQQNPDVAGQGMDAAMHYVLHGEGEGRRPCPQFDPAAYLRANPDVARDGGNAFVHFLTRGRSELRASATETGNGGQATDDRGRIR